MAAGISSHINLDEDPVGKKGFVNVTGIGINLLIVATLKGSGRHICYLIPPFLKNSL